MGYRITIECDIPSDKYTVSFSYGNFEDCLSICLHAIEVHEDLPAALSSAINDLSAKIENEARPELVDEFMELKRSADRYYNALYKLEFEPAQEGAETNGQDHDSVG